MTPDYDPWPGDEGLDPSGRLERPSETPLVTAARLLTAAALMALFVACRSTVPADGDLETLTTCRDAFQRWVDGEAELNQPGADIVAVAASQELVQRRVFELCGLDEAEDLNREILPARPSGIIERLIEPDIRTFATVECVDEAPLLDGTKLCAEVNR